MENVEVDERFGELGHLQYQNENTLLMFEELLETASTKITDEKRQEIRRNLAEAAQQSRDGVAWDFRRVIIIGQKGYAD